MPVRIKVLKVLELVFDDENVISRNYDGEKSKERKNDDEKFKFNFRVSSSLIFRCFNFQYIGVLTFQHRKLYI